ncbi:MAG: hypothetical protein RLZZ398_1188 [Verrucomicrobiota bacterium]
MATRSSINARGCSASMRGFLNVFRRCSVVIMRTGGGVIFIELLGALRALEFMALAGNGQ